MVMPFKELCSSEVVQRLHIQLYTAARSHCSSVLSCDILRADNRSGQEAFDGKFPQTTLIPFPNAGNVREM